MAKISNYNIKYISRLARALKTQPERREQAELSRRAMTQKAYQILGNQSYLQYFVSIEADNVMNILHIKLLERGKHVYAFNRDADIYRGHPYKQVQLLKLCRDIINQVTGLRRQYQKRLI